MYSSISISVITFMLVLESVAGIICYPKIASKTTTEKPWRAPAPSSRTTTDNPTYKNNFEAITCIHRYINVTGNQQKEIANYTLNIPTQHKIDRSFFIKVEKFDDNTEIYCVKDKNESLLTNVPMSAVIGDEITVFKLSANSFTSKTIMTVINVNLTKNEELTSFKYNETKNVSFSCQEHTPKTNYVQLGIINKTSNMIETYLETKINQTFNIINNGTILCCIYYILNEYEATRFVTNKTLLVYDDGNKNGRQRDISKGTVNITNDAKMDFAEEQSLTTASSDKPKIYKIVTAVALTVFILLIVVVIWKRRCGKKTKSNHKVLYAELDHCRPTQPGMSARSDIRSRANPKEESPYAQIIGEMRPNAEEESPYAQVNGEMRPNLEEESPYAQVTGEMRPNLKEESPYAQVNGEMRPNLEEESPYAQVTGEMRPNLKEESPYAQVNGEMRPNLEEESPYAQVNREMRPNLEEESPYAQVNGEMRPNLEEESPYAQVTGEMRPNPKEESPYAQIIGKTRSNPEEEAPYAQIIGKTRPNPKEEAPYAQIIKKTRPNPEEEAPYAQIIKKTRPNPEEDSPYAQIIGKTRPQ